MACIVDPSYNYGTYLNIIPPPLTTPAARKPHKR
jgi:hypothetical protein